VSVNTKGTIVAVCVSDVRGVKKNEAGSGEKPDPDSDPVIEPNPDFQVTPEITLQAPAD
jgi:hypothetical protein